MKNSNILEGLNYSLRTVDEGIIVLDFEIESLQVKPSFLIPEVKSDTLKLEKTSDERQQVTTKAHNVILTNASIKLFRKTDNECLCEICHPSSEAVLIKCDRSYPFYGIGANNWSESIDRRGKKYCVHHRVTRQGNNHMPWVLSSQGFGLFFDSTYPMTIDFEDKLFIAGKKIRSVYFIDGPTPEKALKKYVRLSGLPPMHPAWALGYEQSSRT